MNKNILILDPLLSQAWALSKRFMAAGYYVVGRLNTEHENCLIDVYNWLLLRRRVNELSFVTDFREHEVIIIPTGTWATAELANQNKVITIGTVSYNPANIIFFNKCEGQSIAKSYGWEVPETWLESEQIPEEFEEVFVKPKAEGFGEIREIMSLEKAKIMLKGGRYIAQKVIRAEGVLGYGFLASEGEVLASSLHHEICSNPPFGGSAVLIKQLRDLRFEDKCIEFIRNIKYSGWGLIECKKNENTGEYIFLELNAKFWASLEFSMRNDKRFSSLLVGTKETKHAVGSMWFVDRTNAKSWKAVARALVMDKDICLHFEPGWLFSIVRNIMKKCYPLKKALIF